MTFFIDCLGQSTMLHVFMSICLEGVCAYHDLCANSIIFEIAWFLFFTRCIYWIKCYWQAALFNDVVSGSDILVASDAVGMGLNLNIRRIIFSTLEYFDGTSMRALTVAEIKQNCRSAAVFVFLFQDASCFGCFWVGGCGFFNPWISSLNYYMRPSLGKHMGLQCRMFVHQAPSKLLQSWSLTWVEECFV